MTISNVPNWKQFEIDGWQECCAELKEFVLTRLSEDSEIMDLVMTKKSRQNPHSISALLFTCY